MPFVASINPSNESINLNIELNRLTIIVRTGRHLERRKTLRKTPTIALASYEWPNAI
jgi:hypothetical protein